MAQDEVRYICPICDEEMSAGSHFCWNCKKFIRNPWRYTGGHLPNEEHKGCHPMQSFLKPREGGTARPHSSGSHTFGKSFTQKSSVPKYSASKYSASGAAYQQDGTQKYPYQQKRSQTNRNSGAGALIIVLIVFWVIVQFILTLAL